MRVRPRQAVARFVGRTIQIGHACYFLPYVHRNPTASPIPPLLAGWRLCVQGGGAGVSVKKDRKGSGSRLEYGSEVNCCN